MYTQAGQLPSIDLVRIQDGEAIDFKVQKKFKDQEKGHRSLGFRRLVEKYQHKVVCFCNQTGVILTFIQLPNMDFPINAKAEGRVLVPWEYQQYSNLTFESSCMNPLLPSHRAGVSPSRSGRIHSRLARSR